LGFPEEQRTLEASMEEGPPAPVRIRMLLDQFLKEVDLPIQVFDGMQDEGFHGLWAPG
jgi:hypothetical protein